MSDATTAVVDRVDQPPDRPSSTVDRPKRRRRWLPWLLAVVVGYLVLLPVGSLLYGAVFTDVPGSPDATFTLDWFVDTYVGVFTGGEIQHVLWNSVAVAVPATILSTGVGVLLAWLITRTNLRARRFFEYGLMVPMFYSPLVGIIAWTILGAPGAGWVNQLWHTVGGSGDLVNIYSYGGIVFALALFYLPYGIMLNTAAFRAMDATQEEAAGVSGANRWRVLRSITFPLLRPSIFASAIFIFIFCLEQFSIPGALGSQVQYETLAYSIYLNVTKYPTNLGLAAAQGTLLLVLTLITLVFYRRMMRKASRFVTVGGKARKSPTVRLGRLRWVATTGCALVLVVGTLLPLATITLRALMSTRDVGIDWSGLTFAGFAELLGTEDFAESLWNSIFLSVVAAIVAVVIGLMIAVSTTRARPHPASTIADYLISTPVALPGTVFGIGLVWAYIGSPFYQTVTLMLLAFVTRYAVFAVRMLGTGLVQIDRSLEEAAMVSGARKSTAVALIELPLLKGAMASAWLLIFLSVMRELATAIMIYGIGSRTLSILTWNYLEDGFYGVASALAVAQVVIVVVIVGVVMLLFRGRVRLNEVVGGSA
jgi:iron(III) transport system permease protein